MNKLRYTLAFTIRWFYKLFYGIKVVGRENLPKDFQSTIIVANHISAHDPILLSTFIHPNIHFMAKQELFRHPTIAWFIRKLGAFPVSRTGPCIRPVRHAIRLIEDRKIVGIFPEGKRNHTGIRLAAKAGSGFVASKVSYTNVLPVAITLQPRQLFHSHHIVIGKVITLSDPLRDYRAFSQSLLTTIYALKESMPETSDSAKPVIE